MITSWSSHKSFLSNATTRYCRHWFRISFCLLVKAWAAIPRRLGGLWSWCSYLGFKMPDPGPTLVRDFQGHHVVWQLVWDVGFYWHLTQHPTYSCGGVLVGSQKSIICYETSPRSLSLYPSHSPLCLITATASGVWVRSLMLIICHHLYKYLVAALTQHQMTGLIIRSVGHLAGNVIKILLSSYFILLVVRLPKLDFVAACLCLMRKHWCNQLSPGTGWSRKPLYSFLCVVCRNKRKDGRLVVHASLIWQNRDAGQTRLALTGGSYAVHSGMSVSSLAITIYITNTQRKYVPDETEMLVKHDWLSQMVHMQHTIATGKLFCMGRLANLHRRKYLLPTLRTKKIPLNYSYISVIVTKYTLLPCSQKGRHNNNLWYNIVQNAAPTHLPTYLRPTYQRWERAPESQHVT